MWPWDHLAIGYLVVSVWRRGRSRRPPREAEVIAVVLGTQLPDLVDKPLGWGTTLLPSGHSLAHSLLVAVPVSVAAYLLARRMGHADVGAAFSLAYLSHLPGDVLYPVILGHSPNFAFLVWPLVELPASQPVELTGRLLELVAQFVAFLQTPRGLTFLSVDVALVLVTVLLWRQDGCPGIATVRRTIPSWRA